MRHSIEQAVKGAVLVAWDGCHKIYLATDEAEADWFRKNADKYHTVKASTETMTDVVMGWWADSCPLRFINATGAAGTRDIIPQRL